LTGSHTQSGRDEAGEAVRYQNVLPMLHQTHATTVKTQTSIAYATSHGFNEKSSEIFQGCGWRLDLTTPFFENHRVKVLIPVRVFRRVARCAFFVAAREL